MWRAKRSPARAGEGRSEMLLPPALRRLLKTQAVRFFECFIRASSVPTRSNDRNEDVVRDLHPTDAVAILVGQEPAVD